MSHLAVKNNIDSLLLLLFYFQLPNLSPIGRSTPVNLPQANTKGATTPSRSLSNLRSSLQRQSSINYLNKSISPKNFQTPTSSTRSLQNLSQSKSGLSIPTPGNLYMLRRKSAGDLKANPTLTRSYEQEKTVSKLSQLKRSSSFKITKL